MKIRYYYYDTNKSVGKKFLTLSDLHVFSEKDIKKLYNLRNYILNSSVVYDAIFVDGDIIDATNALRFNSKVTAELLSFMEFLGSVAPTFIAYGSHDLGFLSNGKWCHDEEIFKDKFLDKIAGFDGIDMLSNGTRDIGDDYTVSVFNLSLDYAMLTPDGNEEILLSDYSENMFLDKLDGDKVNILLCHYPNAIVLLWENGYLTQVDLGIGGHNHAGITQFLPLELFLNLIGQRHRGLITPGKKLLPNNIRGEFYLDDRAKLLINPAVTTFADSAGGFKLFDSLFYQGASEITFNPIENMTRRRVK